MSIADTVDCASFRDEIASFPALDRPAERHLSILRWLTRLCEALGCAPPILVGCGAVELYTDARTAMGDVDIITPNAQKLGACLLEIGFQRSQDQRFWFYPSHSLLLEFPPDSLREGEQTVTIPADGVDCLVISPEDLIAGRLEGFEAVGGGIDLIHAYLVYHSFFKHLDHDRLKTRIKQADVLESFKFIRHLYDEAQEKGLSIDEQGARLSLECRRRKGVV